MRSTAEVNFTQLQPTTRHSTPLSTVRLLYEARLGREMERRLKAVTRCTFTDEVRAPRKPPATLRCPKKRQEASHFSNR